MPHASAHPDLFVLTHEFAPGRGGIATFTEEMARSAAELGRAVEVWAPAADADSPAPSEPFGVRRLPIRGTHGPACVFTTWRALIAERRRWRGADLHLCEPGPMLAMMLLPDWRMFRPRRLLLTFHGSEILRFHANPVLRRLTRRLLRRADRISLLTDYTDSLLLARFPEAAGKIVRTPGAPRANLRITATPPPRSDPDRVVVLTVGRIHPRKGQLCTLRALAALPPELKARVDYHIVGRARHEQHERELRAAAADSGLNVRFRGDLSETELADAYREADIFALTSIPHGHSVEGFGLVYLEASAHRLPVVAHAIGGVPEAVLDGETGLLAPPGQQGALTATFALMIGDPALRRRLGAAGREWAARHRWIHSAEVLYGP